MRSEKFSLQDAEKGRQRRSRLESILNVAQRLRPPVLSSAAALLNGLFEHPAGSSGSITIVEITAAVLKNQRCFVA